MRLVKPKNNSKTIYRTVVTGLILAIILMDSAVPVTYASTDTIFANFSQNVKYSTPVSNAIYNGMNNTIQIAKEKPDRVIKGVITAYSSTIDQCDEDPFTAASGKQVYDGMIAANGLPFGTKIKIPSVFGDKVFTVDDRMNARYGIGRMDVWMDAPRKEVNKFGVKRADIEIYYPEAVTKIAKVDKV